MKKREAFCSFCNNMSRCPLHDGEEVAFLLVKPAEARRGWFSHFLDEVVSLRAAIAAWAAR